MIDHEITLTGDAAREFQHAILHDDIEAIRARDRFLAEDDKIDLELLLKDFK